MKRLSTGQMERVSEILGNICVAWFSAGVISPLFVRPENAASFLLTFGVSIAMAGFFFAISINLVKEVEK